LMQTLTRAAPRELCLSHVQLQAVCTHPFSYILHTGCNLLIRDRAGEARERNGIKGKRKGGREKRGVSTN